MSSEVVAIRPQGNELSLASDAEFWNDKQIAALRQLGVENASNGDLAVYHHVCQRTGLDPFARQIYMIRRDGKQTIQTGIDGFRLVARRAVDRTGEALSIGAPEWCGPDGKWRDVWLEDGPPAAARIVVRRGAGEFPAVALWREYHQTKRDGTVTSMWATRPAGQLAKCAEALALRKAFPQDLSGVYSRDEMGGRDVVESHVERVTAAEILGDDEPGPSDPEPITAPQSRRLHAVFGQIGWSDRDDKLRAASLIVGRPLESSKDLTKDEATGLIDELEQVAQADDPSDALTTLLEALAGSVVVDAEVVGEGT